MRQGGTSVLVSCGGDLDAAAGPALRAALAALPAGATTILLDMHGVDFADSAGLLLVLDFHRGAQALGLRVLPVGWQRQPQRVMAALANLPPDVGDAPPPPEWDRVLALAGFRRMVAQRAEAARGRTVDRKAGARAASR
ncbi:STAS domain-containing protein [Streptomyces sp. NPDC054838]